MYVILGLIALPIVLLLLVIFLILCLGKIRYRVDAEVGNENAIHVEVSYFRYLVRYAFSYVDGEMKSHGRIVWKRIGEEPESKLEPEPERESEPIEYKSAEPINPSGSTISIKTETPTTKTEAPPNKEIEKPIKQEEKKPEDKKPKGKKDLVGFLNQIREFAAEHDVKNIIGLTFKCLGKLLKAFKPKHIDISGEIGFDDPATTGWTMGAYEAIVGVAGFRPYIRILGNYFEKALHLNIDTHGRTRVGSLFWPFVWLVFQKPVRKLIWKQIRG